jgi:hypothetical protein
MGSSFNSSISASQIQIVVSQHGARIRLAAASGHGYMIMRAHRLQYSEALTECRDKLVANDR